MSQQSITNKQTRFRSLDENLSRDLQEGSIAVLPTDTLYGLSAHADHDEAVERVYQVKGRDRSKPVITLISRLDDLTRFGVVPTDYQRRHLEQVWPGRTSVIFPTMLKSQYHSLHRGTQKLAFRIPADERLREFVSITGPIIAPSANPEGYPPATRVEHALEYFADAVEHYIDDGERAGNPSELIDLSNDVVTVIRPAQT